MPEVAGMQSDTAKERSKTGGARSGRGISAGSSESAEVKATAMTSPGSLLRAVEASSNGDVPLVAISSSKTTDLKSAGTIESNGWQW